MEERGILSLDDSIVKHANPYLNAISNGTSDLLQLFGPKIQGVTLRQLLQMSAGIQEYDSANVRTYQNAHRLEDLTPMWIFDNMDRTFLCDPGTAIAARTTCCWGWSQHGTATPATGTN